MVHLKSRTLHPPYGFQFLLPEIGMKTPFKGSFNECVSEFGRIVKANPAMAEKQKWPDFVEGQIEWMDHHNAHRLQASGFADFVDTGEGQYIPPVAQKKTSWRGSAAVGNLVSGAAIWKEMFGAEGATVARPLAESRAPVCVGCPENDKQTGLINLFTAALAGQLNALFELMKGKGLSTSKDDQLGVCKICLCPLKSKVHASLDVILKNMKPETVARLPEWCWIRTESK